MLVLRTCHRAVHAAAGDGAGRRDGCRCRRRRRPRPRRRGRPRRPSGCCPGRRCLRPGGATGSPVEIVADRTDSSQTFAEPNGGYATRESVLPVRTRAADGQWVGIDTTLTRRSDGRIAPVAITTGLTLSPGGAGPLYVLTEDGASMSVSWPYGSLPMPTLQGATATYPDVLPGVNLLVSARASGVTRVGGGDGRGGGGGSTAGPADVPDHRGRRRRNPRRGRRPERRHALRPYGVHGAAAADVGFRRGRDRGCSHRKARGHDAATVAIQTGGPVPGDRSARMTVGLTSTGISLGTDRQVLTGAVRTLSGLHRPRVGRPGVHRCHLARRVEERRRRGRRRLGADER